MGTTAEKNEMVKIKVISPFRDKTNPSIRFAIGDELDFDVDRAQDVTNRGLAEYVEPIG